MQNRTSSAKIARLKKNEIFVFGSNKDGNHAGGAAAIAVKKFGAVHGQGHGLQGNSYAIDSMSGEKVLQEEITKFIACAQHTYPQNIFLVTEIGCGIAGFTPEQIALFPERFQIIEEQPKPKKSKAKAEVQDGDTECE